VHSQRKLSQQFGEGAVGNRHHQFGEGVVVTVII
jgi:hypothetical protein